MTFPRMAVPLFAGCVVLLCASPTLARDAGLSAKPLEGFSVLESSVPEKTVTQSPPAPPGALSTRVLIGPDERGLRKVGLVSVTLRGDFQREEHAHGQMEMLVVLEGQLNLSGGKGAGNRLLLRQGDAALVPPRHVHGWSRPGGQEGQVRFLVLTAPSDAALEADAYAVRTAEPASTKAPVEPLVAKRLRSAATHPILQGKGAATLLIEKGAASGLDSAPSAGWLELQSGVHVPEHVHAAEDEVLYVVSGEAELTMAKKKTTVTAGTAIHIPANVRHEVRVTSQEALRTVQFYAPAGPEQRFKPAPPDAGTGTPTPPVPRSGSAPKTP